MSFAIDPEVLRSLKLAPQVPDEGSEDVPTDRIVRSVRGDWFEALIRAGESGESDGAKFTDFVASTADVDRMGDVIDQKTWRLANYRRNPVILHEHGGGLFGTATVVGRGVAKVDRDVGRLMIRSYWDTADINPLGQLMAHQHANGFRRASSVGFLPGKAISRADLDDTDPRSVPGDTPRWKAGHVFSHNELLEHSTVAVPANPKATQLSLRSQDIDANAGPTEATKRFVTESVSKAAAENILQAIKSDDQIRAAIRALVWSGHAPPTEKGDPLSHLFNK